MNFNMYFVRVSDQFWCPAGLSSTMSLLNECACTWRPNCDSPVQAQPWEGAIILQERPGILSQRIVKGQYPTFMPTSTRSRGSSRLHTICTWTENNVQDEHDLPTPNNTVLNGLNYGTGLLEVDEGCNFMISRKGTCYAQI